MTILLLILAILCAAIGTGIAIYVVGLFLWLAIR